MDMNDTHPEDVDRTVVISEREKASAGASAPVPETPDAGDRNRSPEEADPGDNVRRSILSDLGNFLFPRRRSLVDETLDLICSGSDA